MGPYYRNIAQVEDQDTNVEGRKVQPLLRLPGFTFQSPTVISARFRKAWPALGATSADGKIAKSQALVAHRTADLLETCEDVYLACFQGLPLSRDFWNLVTLTLPTTKSWWGRWRLTAIQVEAMAMAYIRAWQPHNKETISGFIDLPAEITPDLRARPEDYQRA